jgi:predicted dehydrogenase
MPSSAGAKPQSTLGVGIIGVNPARGWAATAHIPALRALPNYEIRALSARSAESARAAGDVFGISAVFLDSEQMVAQADIDVVAVTVKVPHHRELVSAALAAGKAVYCEWPLGRDLDDARAMAELAAEQGVRTVVGLQARQAPAIEFVQQLLSDGYVGEVLSTTMIGLSITGETLAQPNAYMLDSANGANVLTIAVGHSLDILNYVLGEFAELSAVSGLRRPLITIEETGEQIVKTAPDQIAVIGTLTSGATANIHVREAVAGGTGFLWEINGTDGTLRITAAAAQPQIFPLAVAGAKGPGEPVELVVPAVLTQKWPSSPTWKARPATTSGVAMQHSRQTSPTELTPCRTSPTP